MKGSPRSAQELAGLLLDPHRALHASRFSRSDPKLEQPGLYSWWADDPGLEDLRRVLGDGVVNPIYAGQAGATKWPSGRRGSATLASRIRTNHIGGNISSSTFRRTLAAVLREPLDLRLAGPGQLIPESNAHLSRWIRAHLSVVTVPYEDRDTLGNVERQVLALLAPPLNLNGMPRTPGRQRLSELRHNLSAGM